MTRRLRMLVVAALAASPSVVCAACAGEQLARSPSAEHRAPRGESTQGTPESPSTVIVLVDTGGR